MSVKTRIRIVGALFALAFANATLAELRVEITEWNIEPAPIAVVPFGWQGSAANSPLDVSSVIAADLQRSGRFAPIDESTMLSQPTRGADVDFDDLCESFGRQL